MRSRQVIKRCRVRLAGNFKHPVEISAYTTPVAGLVVHRAVDVNGEFLSAWRVTHSLSGYATNRWCNTRRDAIAWARKLGRRADWTRSADELRKDGKLRSYVLGQRGLIR